MNFNRQTRFVGTLGLLWSLSVCTSVARADDATTPTSAPTPAPSSAVSSSEAVNTGIFRSDPYYLSHRESQPQPLPDIASGKATQSWMDAQASQTQASKHQQTLSGPVMSRVYQRYLDSFKEQQEAPTWGQKMLSN